jgi:DNA-binding LacI/PurR family transcriptional regulator
MPQAARRVTALDVARAAGVSKTTVSYVLNDTPHQSIPEGTRQRVLDAAQSLDYTPLSAARALRRGRTDTVVCILPDWPLDRILALTVDSLIGELERRGLFLVTRRRRSGRSVDVVRELAPAAVIAFGSLPESEVAGMEAAGTFVAAALLTFPASPDHALVVPQELIGAMQVQHLAARGHRRLAYAASADARVADFLQLRLAGARRACLELGLEMPAVYELELSLDSALTALTHWRNGGPRPTAVIAYNDEIAVALLAAMRTLGLTAPDDLAVIGVDNEPLSQFAAPPLTTVDQHHELIAAHLAEVVTCGLSGQPLPDSPRSEALSLVVRESA